LIAGLRWRARRWFWNHFGIFKYDHNRPGTVPVPVAERRLDLVPLASMYHGIPIERALVADRIPDDERQTVKRDFSRLQAALYRVVSPQQRRLPPVDADPGRALEVAYTAAHRRRFPPPVRPAALGHPQREEDRDGPDLGALAVASPFACYVTAEADGIYTWDLRELDGFEHHKGLRSLGSVVTFEANPAAADGDGLDLTAVKIDCDAGACAPDDPDWPLARRLALSGASMHLSIVRHFGWLHLAAGGPLAVVSRNELPPDHPLRRLLWPHVYATQYSNDLITVDQLVTGGDFEGMFSLTHRGVSALMDATVSRFSLGVIDPDLDASTRGLRELDLPSVDNRRRHHAVFLAHARRYLERYYEDDDRIAADPAVQAWWAALAQRVPGVERVGAADVSVEGVARLAAAVIQLATVEHEILGSGMWDYQLWSDAFPGRVPTKGTRPPLDVYQRLVNANFNLNVHRTALLTDFSDLALDPGGAEAFRTFRSDLLALQTEFDASPGEPWRMEPKRLKANINA
jgi:arachidonate 15-lipoxygenase